MNVIKKSKYTLLLQTLFLIALVWWGMTQFKKPADQVKVMEYNGELRFRNY